MSKPTTETPTRVIGAPADLSTYVRRKELAGILDGIVAGAGRQQVHDQDVPLATWTIPHLFGRRPNVTVYVGDEEILADVTATRTTVTITHAAPTAGQAILT